MHEKEKQMSTTRNILRAGDSFLESFVEDFGSYLDSLDYAFHLQGQIGVPDLSVLSETEQKRFKSYLFLTNSVNTTTMGALRLFSSNFYSDAFALLRMIYEAASLMHYGNKSPQKADEVYRSIFKSGLNEHEHFKGEWALIRKAEGDWEKQNADLIPIRQYINNFGAHISRAKIVLGNVTMRGNESIPSIFSDNSRKSEFVMGLDMLHNLFMMALEEWDKQAALYVGALPSLRDKILAHTNRFIKEIRPKLQEKAGIKGK